MSSMCYQTLSFVECLEILRQAKAVRAAFFDGHAPYVVPMGFEWFVNGMQPVVCLMMPKEGRKAEALSVCTQVCLEFEAPDAAAIQVVLAEGSSRPPARGGRRNGLCDSGRNHVGAALFFA